MLRAICSSPLSFLTTTLLQLSIAVMKSISGFASSMLLLAGMAVANLNILMTNDDGFGSANIRVRYYLPTGATELISRQAFKEALEAQGHSVLIVGPVRSALLPSPCTKADAASAGEPERRRRHCSTAYYQCY